MNDSASRARVSGYSHVGIAVTDLEAARAFYVDRLRLTELPRPDLGIPGIWLRVGDLQLHLFESGGAPRPAGGMAHIALYVAPDDFDATIEELRDGGTTFAMGPTRNGDERTAFVTDPSGNLVELTTVGPLSG